VNNISKTKALC